MPDIGALKVAELTINPGDGTTVAVLSVLTPDGQTLTPSVTIGHTGGVATATAELDFDIEGRWVLHWTVTGTGAGPRFEVVVISAPPTTELRWPPSLRDLKIDIKMRPDDDRDDEELDQVLSAAMALIQRVRASDFNFSDESGSDKPVPSPDICLGVLRLAGRWKARRISPDALIQMADGMASGRVPSFDTDIDRLLGLGRYRKSVIA